MLSAPVLRGDQLIRRLCHAHLCLPICLLTCQDATYWCAVCGDVERCCAAKKRPDVGTWHSRVISCHGAARAIGSVPRAGH